MFINKLLITLIITFFVFTKFVAADDLEDRVKELEAKIDQMLTPELAEILIKLVGDVSFLTEVRDNKSN